MARTKILPTILLFLAICAVAYGLLLLRRGFSARDNPSALEAVIARSARCVAIPSRARQRKNPFTATPEVLAEARAHFADHCATCHANNGSGNTSIGQNLYPKAPDMRQPPTQNLTDGEFYYIIHNGIRLTGMPAWGTGEPDDDSWKLVVFIRHLPELTQEEEREMQHLNPRSAADLAEEQEEHEFLGGAESTNQEHKSHRREQKK